MQWWYGINGQQHGPVDDEGLRTLVREGKLKPDNLVWNTSMGSQWAQAGSIPGLFPGRPPLPPPVGEALAISGTGGQTHNRDLMAQARQRLQGNWGIAIVTALIFSVLTGVGGAIPFIGILISFTISGPLSVGQARFFLSLGRGVVSGVGVLFSGFREFGNAIVAYLLVVIFTVLWTLLLIVPGIVAALSYAQTFYILADHPEIGGQEAIRRSKRMMMGYKWKLFCLGWRFLGWGLLCLLTCGIGFLWLMPYMQTSYAQFYDDLQTSPAVSTAPQA